MSCHKIVDNEINKPSVYFLSIYNPNEIKPFVFFFLSIIHLALEYLNKQNFLMLNENAFNAKSNKETQHIKEKLNKLK